MTNLDKVISLWDWDGKPRIGEQQWCVNALAHIAESLGTGEPIPPGIARVFAKVIRDVNYYVEQGYRKEE